MRILVLTNYANGLWLFRKELLQSFLDAGHDVLIAAPIDENSHKLEPYSTELIDVPLERHGSNPFRDLTLYKKYKAIIKEKRPDVALTYTIKPNIYGGLACKFSKVPYICNITGLGTAIENGGLMSKVLIMMYRAGTAGAKKVFFQNERNRKFMQDRGVARKNSGLLPGSGVNLSEHPFHEYPGEEEGIHFLAVIRIMKDKGMTEFLEMTDKITDEYDNARFDLVSEYEEDERAFYEPRINDMVSKGKLKYHGHVDFVEPYMEKCHVVVHPSYHEGMSNVLLEAAACGRPILCSDIHGCIEAVDKDKSGFTFEPRSTEALTDSVRRILALSPEERAQMGVLGRRFIEKNFDRRIVLDAYKAELDSLRKS